jgi:hypothetical protein
MSIYKQIFATASIFAIAAAFVVTPSASAAGSIEVNGYISNNTNQSLCLRQATTTAPATLVVSGVYPTSSASTATPTFPVAPSVSGTNYELYTVNGTASNSCTVGTAANVFGFTAYDKHTALVTYPGTTAGSSFRTRDQLAAVTSTNGSNVVNFCLGKTDKVTVTVTDPDGDLFSTAPTPTIPSDLIASAATVNGASISWDIQPTLNAAQTIGTKGTINFAPAATNYQYTLTTPDSSIYATPVTNLTFNVANSCAVVAPVVSSSSMMSSSSSAAAVTPASAVAAASSKATVEVSAPEVSSGKGSATVRTGGAY